MSICYIVNFLQKRRCLIKLDSISYYSIPVSYGTSTTFYKYILELIYLFAIH